MATVGRRRRGTTGSKSGVSVKKAASNIGRAPAVSAKRSGKLQAQVVSAKHGLARSLLLAFAVVLVMVVALRLLAMAFPGLQQWLVGINEAYGLPGTFIAIFLGSTLLPFPTDLFFMSIIAFSREPLNLLIVAIASAFISGLANYCLAFFLSKAWVEKMVGRHILGEATHLSLIHI